MAATKHSFIRYRILDYCFSDFRNKYSIEDLLDQVNEVLYKEHGVKIRERQLREDINFMRNCKPVGAPIEAIKYDRNKAYYQYSDPNYSFFKDELSIDEINHLRSTINMLKRYSGLPSNIWLEEIISKLEIRLGVTRNSENVVSFDQNEQLKGLEFLSQIIDATLNHQTLQIKYCNYSGKETNHFFHPYHVKQYNNRWFVFGLEETEKGNFIYNKALDRIIRIVKTRRPYIKNDKVDFSTFFKDFIGVTAPGKDIGIEQIVLKFDAKRFPYVISKPIHPSQQIINKDQNLIKISVRPNKELISQIMYFGPQVEVVSPSWFRDLIVEKIEENLKKYKSMH